MSKAGEMMDYGKIVVVGEDDVVEPEHCTLIVLEDDVVYTRSKNMPILAILQGAVRAALGAGVGKNTLTAFVEGVIKDVYTEDSGA